MTAWILAALLANTSAAAVQSNEVGETKGAPHISNFVAQEIYEGIWAFTGTVTDPDEDPTGSTVYFYGILNGHSATVLSNDTFALYIDLGSAYGPAGAQSEDSDGNKSNIAVTQVH